MASTRLIIIHAVGSAVSLAVYALAVLLFAIMDTSEFVSSSRLTRPVDLTYFALYSVYFGLYLGSVAALARGGPVLSRAFFGAGMSLAGPSVIFLCFPLGILIGIPLFFFGGPFGALLAAPITGAIAGMGFNTVLEQSRLCGRVEYPVITQMKANNIMIAALCAGLAGYMAFAPSQGPELLGRARILRVALVGLAGPILHAGVLIATAVGQCPPGRRWLLSRQATGALTGIIAAALSLLAGGVAITSIMSGGRLWTTESVLSTFARPEDVRQRRKPPADQPVRIGNYVVDRKPGDLKNSTWDWGRRIFRMIEFDLGTVATMPLPTPVLLRIQPKSLIRGVAYRCDDTMVGGLIPCQFVHEPDRLIQSGPRIFRTALYSGGVEIGSVDNRLVLITCRHPNVCQLEFAGEYYPELHIVLVFSWNERNAWQDIVRSAIPQIEHVVRRVD